MTTTQPRFPHLPQWPLVSLFIIFATIAIIACSNSETVGADIEGAAVVHCPNANVNIFPSQEETTTKIDSLRADTTITAPTSIDSIHPREIVCDTISEYLPLDDSEYPYAGIPRIVIETENHRKIKDRTTEIPAKLQIWGKKEPESSLMALTIKGRGNTTWDYPKKPYTITFTKKQSILGMPNAKKWIMLANYRDRTLIRSALAFEIARNTSQKWVPQGRFVEVFLNKKYLGNYYICEKIQASKNRLNLGQNDYLLELDTKYDGENKFKSSYKNFPISIKHPDQISNEQFSFISGYINSIECSLYGDCNDQNMLKKINLQSLASYWIIQEISQNNESGHPKSVYAFKDSVLNFGPIWDYDWNTFSLAKKGFQIKNYLWLDTLSKNKLFIDIVKQEWNTSKSAFSQKISFIDSLANYTKQSNERNHKIWPIKLESGLVGDENKEFSESFQMLKEAYQRRLEELDQLFNSL